MAYGILKCDTVTFTNAGVDKSVTLSGLVQNPTFSGNVTVTGTVSGTTATFTTGTFTSLTGTTSQGTTATYTSGSFTSLTGVTTSGTTANFVSGVFTTQISGATITGTAGAFATLTGGVATLTSGVFALGTEALPSITFTGDTDTGIYSPGANQVAIITSGNSRLFVDSNGQVGVGTTNPVALLDVAGAAQIGAATGVAAIEVGAGATENRSAYIDFVGDTTYADYGLRIIRENTGANTDSVLYHRGTGALVFNAVDSGPFVFIHNNTERARITNDGTVNIKGAGSAGVTQAVSFNGSAPVNSLVVDSSGRLLVGTSSARSNFFNSTVSSAVHIEASTNNGRFISLVNSGSGGGSGGGIILGASAGTNGLATGELGIISFQGNDGAEFVEGARIDAIVDGTLAYPATDLENGQTYRIVTVGTTNFMLIGASANTVGTVFTATGPGTGTGTAILNVGNMPGRLVFSTTADGASSPTERMRITSGGNVGVGNNAPNTRLHVADGEFTISTGGNASDNGGIINFGITTFSTFSPMATIQGLLSNVAGTELQGGLGFFTREAGTAGQALQRRMTISSQGNVGIGTTNPLAALNIGADGDFWLSSSVNTVEEKNLISWRIEDGSEGARISAFREAVSNAPHSIAFFTRTSGGLFNEKARIDSSGRLLVGTSTSRSNWANTTGTDPLFQIETNGDARASITRTSANEFGPQFWFGKTRGTAYQVVSSADQLGEISFMGADGTELVSAASITAAVDGTPGANDMPGRLVFSTTADGGSSPTERMRITNKGACKITEDGGIRDANSSYHELRNNLNSEVVVIETASSSYTSFMQRNNCYTAASSSYTFFDAHSGNFNDREFHLRGDGNAFADGTWTGGGADYAEYFEWSDSNPDAEDRRGISVVLDGDKIREAVAGEDPIGVISGNPSVVGDAAWNKWSGKYLRDEFGTYIQEDYEVTDDDGNTVIQHRRKLNPAYDPDVEYISREQRPEWDCVGLMGKLRIRKGQVTGSRWIKMRDISATVEEWLVR